MNAFKSLIKKLNFIPIFFMCACIAFFTFCEDDEEESKPEIVGCNSVEYKGTTFSNLGCAYGIASFDISGSQNGKEFDFHIECENGCISKVTLN